jgi:hypothetical protein
MTSMADSAYGVVKVDGFTATGYESLTSNFEFITITTAIPIMTFAQWLTAESLTATTATANQLAQARASQAALDKLIQIVAERGQPVIMGTITVTTPPITGPFSVLMAIEHPYAWQSTATAASTPSYSSTGVSTAVDPRANEDLVAKIKADGINYGFGANVTLVYTDPIGGGTYSSAFNDTSTLAVTFSTVLT